VLSASQDGTVVVSDVRHANESLSPSALSPRFAALSGFDGLHVLDLGNHEPMRRVGGSSYPLALTISADGTTLAAVQDDRVHVWDARSRKPIGTSVRLRSTHVEALALNGDGRRIAAGGGSSVRVWDIRGDGRPTQFKTGLRAVARVALSPDGNTVAVADRDGRVELWAAIGTRLGPALKADTGSSYEGDLEFSPDGRLLAASSDPGTVTLWDAGTGQPRGALLSSQIDGVTAVAFSADGKTLATGDDDYRVRLWDLASHRMIGLPLRGNTSTIDDLTFSPDGRSVFSSNHDGTVRAWNDLLWANADDARRRACGLVGTGLTHEEWRMYAPDLKFQRGCA
jgi:WD40 repeat protein